MKEATLKKVMDTLSNANPENGDILDVLAVLIGDIDDLFKAKDKAEWKKQYKDAKATLKHLLKMLRKCNCSCKCIKCR